MPDYTVDDLLRRIEEQVQSGDPRVRCISLAERGKRPCIFPVKKEHRKYLGSLPKIFKKYSEQSELSIDDAAEFKAQAKDEAERLTCGRDDHKKWVNDAIDEYFEQASISLEPKEVPRKEPMGHQQSPQPSTPPRKIQEHKAPRVTSVQRPIFPASPTSTTRRNSSQPSYGQSEFSFASPASTISITTPASSYDSVFSAANTPSSPFTPETPSSKPKTKQHQSYFLESPTRKGHHPRGDTFIESLGDEEHDDRDDNTRDTESEDESSEQVQAERKLFNPDFDNKETENGLEELVVGKSLKLFQDRPRRTAAPIIHQAPKVASHILPSSIEKFSGIQHDPRTRFHIPVMIEKDLANKDNEAPSHIYVATSTLLQGYVKVGVTKHMVHHRYKRKTQQCPLLNNLKFRYRTITPFKGAYRVEALTQAEYSLERFRIPCSGGCKSTKSHIEWYRMDEAGIERLCQSIDMWSQFVSWAYTNGKLSDGGKQVLYKAWTWDKFVTTVGESVANKSTSLQSKPQERHKLGRIHPESSLDAMKKIENDPTHKAWLVQINHPTNGALGRERNGDTIRGGVEQSATNTTTPDSTKTAATTKVKAESLHSTNSDEGTEGGLSPIREVSSGDNRENMPEERNAEEPKANQDTEVPKPKFRIQDIFNELSRHLMGKTRSTTEPRVPLQGLSVNTRQATGSASPTSPKVGIQRRWTERLGISNMF